jgi:hypothetical protein
LTQQIAVLVRESLLKLLNTNQANVTNYSIAFSVLTTCIMMVGIRLLRPYRGLRGWATQYAKVLAKTGQTVSPQSLYRFPSCARFPFSGAFCF